MNTEFESDIHIHIHILLFIYSVPRTSLYAIVPNQCPTTSDSRDLREFRCFFWRGEGYIRIGSGYTTLIYYFWYTWQPEYICASIRVRFCVDAPLPVAEWRIGPQFAYAVHRHGDSAVLREVTWLRVVSRRESTDKPANPSEIEFGVGVSF